MTPIHAKYSASGAHRWLVCGASVGYTDETTSEYAEEGARLHKLAEQGEIAEYKEFIKELNCTEVMYEKRVELVAYFAYGTADCIAYDSHTASIYVIDLKTGHNYPEAMDNPQLAFYACSLYGADEVTCYIYHLPTKSHKGWTMKQEDLKKWRRKFIDRIIEIEYQGKDKEFVEGEHCKYCPRAKSCPKLNKLALDYDKIDAYTLLKSKKLIEKHIDAVENDIRERLSKEKRYKVLC